MAPTRLNPPAGAFEAAEDRRELDGAVARQAQAEGRLGTLARGDSELGRGVGGLTLDSILLCEQMRVIDRRRIVRVLGRLEPQYLDDVASAIRTILGV